MPDPDPFDQILTGLAVLSLDLRVHHPPDHLDMARRLDSIGCALAEAVRAQRSERADLGAVARELSQLAERVENVTDCAELGEVMHDNPLDPLAGRLHVVALVVGQERNERAGPDGDAPAPCPTAQQARSTTDHNEHSAAELAFHEPPGASLGERVEQAITRAAQKYPAAGGRDLVSYAAELVSRIAAMAGAAAALPPGTPAALETERRICAALDVLAGGDGTAVSDPDPLSALGLSALDLLWLEAGARACDFTTGTEDLVYLLAKHGADGCRRSGSWERSWIQKIAPFDNGDPIDLVECAHNWQPLSETNPLLSCAGCHSYRRPA